MALRTATERMTLDVSRPEVQKSLSVTQGDTARRWEIKLSDRGQSIEIGKRWTAAISGIKPDGKILYNGCSVATGRIIYDFAAGTEIATAEGAYEVTIEVYDEEGEILHAPKIWLNVLQNRNRSVASEDQFTAAQDLVRKMNDILLEFDGMYVEDLPGKISDLSERIGNIEYTMDPLKILKLEANAYQNNRPLGSSVEIGSTLTRVLITWELNSIPESTYVNEVHIDALIGDNPGDYGVYNPEDGKNLYLSAPGKKTWTLKVKAQGREDYATASTSVVFANRIYYGASAAPSLYDGEFVKSLANKPLRESKMSSITVNAGAGQYIYYCQPTRLGTCVFSFGANTGGVSLVDTILLTNDSGYSENYYVYRSDEPGLGNTTLGVK